MNADQTTLRIITGWVTNLAELTRHGEAKPTKDKLAIYATMLGKDFPSGAFTSDSLHHVASGSDWFPSFEGCRSKLAEWWKVNRPASVGQIAGPHDGETESVKWARRCREMESEWNDIPTVRAAIDTLRREGWPHRGLALLRTLLKRWAPENIEMLDAVLEAERGGGAMQHA